MEQPNSKKRAAETQLRKDADSDGEQSPAEVVAGASTTEIAARRKVKVRRPNDQEEKNGHANGESNGHTAAAATTTTTEPPKFDFKFPTALNASSTISFPPTFTFNFNNNAATTATPTFSFPSMTTTSTTENKGSTEITKEDKAEKDKADKSKTAAAPFHFDFAQFSNMNQLPTFTSFNMFNASTSQASTQSKDEEGSGDEGAEEYVPPEQNYKVPKVDLPLSNEPVKTGEEEEERLFEEKCKLYTFEKGENNVSTWKERGSGIIRINLEKNADESKRKSRLIMRTQETKRLLLNVRILKETKAAKADDKNVRLTAFEETAVKSFLIKFENKVAEDFVAKLTDCASKAPVEVQ